MAVGGTQAHQWNGSNWAVQTLPIPANANGAGLSGVSCTSPTSCMAVGYYNITLGPDVVPDETLAEQWNGATWTIVPTPNPLQAAVSYLTTVSCTSASTCTAVGYWQNQSNMDVSLVERYNG
jgi:hypothetical protein